MKFKLKNPEIKLNPEIRLKRSADANLVGLEIEAGSIGAAEIGSDGSLAKVATQALPAGAYDDGEVVDPAAVTAAVKSLFEANKLSKRVRLGIANQRVVVRTLRLPAIEDPKELDSAIRFSAQEQIAMPLEQAVIDHRVVGGVQADGDSPPQIDVMVVAARRDMIANSLKPLRDAGLEPVGVDLAAFGMIRALGEAATADADGDPAAPQPTAGAILYCNVGDVTNLAVAKGRTCLFTRVSPAGLDNVAASLGTATGLTLEHARMWLEYTGLAQPLEQIEGDQGLLGTVRAELERGADALLDDLRLSLDFYGAQEAAVPVERVVLCGPGSAIAGLAERLEAGLALPIATGRPEALGALDATAAARLTLPYGLALEN